VDSLSHKIIDIVRKVTGRPDGPIALHEPTFSGNAWQYVKDCIDTNWVSTVGKYVMRFEQLLEQRTGARHVIATVNGTAALHISLLLAGVQSGDEVLMPALTFVAPANAVAYCGAVPHFVDVDSTSLGVCPDRLREYLEKTTSISAEHCLNKQSGKIVRALIVMHCFGHPARLDELKKVCDDFKLVLIEDAAEAVGSLYHRRHVGNHGLLSTLSFNGNKTITTGGGGAIMTNDDELAERARHLTTTGKLPHDWEYYHDCIAYNYRLPNLNAALGCAQLETLNEFLERKRLLAWRYQELFAGIEEIAFLPEPPETQSNYWLNAIMLKKPDLAARDRLLSDLHADGIKARPAWRLMNELPMFLKCPAAPLPVSQSILAGLINLPSSPL
jgi:perosamine synthetase